MTQSNGTTEPAKEPSYIDRLDKEFQAKGGKTDPKTVKSALSNWETARAAKVAAQEALDKAMQAESDASVAVIRLVGKKQFRYKGSDYIPMSKGERVWIRPQTSGEVRELG